MYYVHASMVAIDLHDVPLPKFEVGLIALMLRKDPQQRNLMLLERLLVVTTSSVHLYICPSGSQNEGHHGQIPPRGRLLSPSRKN